MRGKGQGAKGKEARVRREGKEPREEEPREEEPHHGEKFCTKERRIRCYCSIASLNLQGWTTQKNITK